MNQPWIWSGSISSRPSPATDSWKSWFNKGNHSAMVGWTFQLSEWFINLPWISMEKPAINGVKHPFWTALFFVSFKLWVPSILGNAYCMHSHIRNHLFCWRDFGRPGMFFLVDMCTLQATSMELKLDPRQSKRQQCFMIESSQANPGSGFSDASLCECETIGTSKKLGKIGRHFCVIICFAFEIVKKKLK